MALGLTGCVLSADHVEQLGSSALAVAEEPLTAVYVGNDPEELIQFEQWLGRPSEGVVLHTGHADSRDWIGSIEWLADRWHHVERRQFWSIPLIPEDVDLSDAAAGYFNDSYREAAKILADRTEGSQIFVRTGWEFNIDSHHWSAIGREHDYVEAYRNFVRSFREVSDRFVFEWCPNFDDSGMNPEDAYPGDDFVDVIGLDFYYQPQWSDPDPIVAWQDMLDAKYGLKWHQAFAAARGKPTSYPEWGVTLETAAPYVDAAASWFRQNPVIYHGYWNSNAAFVGRISDDRVPEVGEAYRRAFGSPETQDDS